MLDSLLITEHTVHRRRCCLVLVHAAVSPFSLRQRRRGFGAVVLRRRSANPAGNQLRSRVGVLPPGCSAYGTTPDKTERERERQGERDVYI